MRRWEWGTLAAVVCGALVSVLTLVGVAALAVLWVWW